MGVGRVLLLSILAVYFLSVKKSRIDLIRAFLIVIDIIFRLLCRSLSLRMLLRLLSVICLLLSLLRMGSLLLTVVSFGMSSCGLVGCCMALFILNLFVAVVSRRLLSVHLFFVLALGVVVSFSLLIGRWLGIVLVLLVIVSVGSVVR